MDLLEKTKDLCRRYGVKPSRSKGQNFLVDEAIYDKMVAASDLNADDVILEVGPGFGFLTERLAKKVKRVIAIELDEKLALVLKERLANQGVNNVVVRNEDILEISNSQYPIANNTLDKGLRGLSTRENNKINSSDTLRVTRYALRGYKVVANLPYNITSRFLRKFLSDDDLRPALMVLMLQKEVAERICARPGKMSLLAVSVQFYAEPEIIEYVPKSAFWPEPEVDSAVLKLKVRSKKLEVNERSFFRTVKCGFSARRKMLKNNLAAGYQMPVEEMEEVIKKAGLNEKARAQDLSLDDWLKLNNFMCQTVMQYKTGR